MTSETASGRCILLATDLSARCDRALDRAVQIAAQRQARLIALYVHEPALSERLSVPNWRHNREQPQDLAKRRLARDLGGAGMDVEMLVEQGKPIDRIRAVAQGRGCELIVTGIAGEETLDRVLLGTTVEKLVRESTTPVLVVKNRPHRPYGNALVATDFSQGSRAAIAAATRLLPDVPFKLYHSYDLPLGSASKGATPAEARTVVDEEAARFLAGTPELAGMDPGRMVIEQGQPEEALSEYVFLNDVELVVAGTHGRTGILRTAMGSVAEYLLERLPCDVMIVRQQGDEE